MADKNDKDSKLVGLLAQFDDPDSLISACNEARLAGYKAMDAYSPFPVHGIDPAIGIQRSLLPFLVFCVGFGACFAGLGMQYYTNAADWSPIFPGYAFKISGKPLFSFPANIPVTFEIIVLSSAFATFLGMWGLNKLPMFSNPLHRISRFKRATNDKFFLMIETKDENFNRSETESQLNQWGAVAIEECRQDLTDNQLPSWVRLVGLLGVFLLMLPPVMIFRNMGMTSRSPRLHVVPDMDWQHKEKTQVLSPVMENGEYLFTDERAMRKPVDGSIARGQLEVDSEMYRGVKKDYKAAANSAKTNARLVSASIEDKEDAPAEPDQADQAEDVSMWMTQFPEGVTVDQAFVERGQQRFNIYCSACHGYDGNGNGLVNQRAMALGANGQAQWTAAKSMHDATVKDDSKNPLGRIFDTITNGRNTMGPYGAQIPAEDRWAIVAYVKALQETGIQPATASTETDGADEEKQTDADGGSDKEEKTS
jgi:mono/diheme cytochrome c family protein